MRGMSYISNIKFYISNVELEIKKKSSEIIKQQNFPEKFIELNRQVANNYN